MSVEAPKRDGEASPSVVPLHEQRLTEGVPLPVPPQHTTGGDELQVAAPERIVLEDDHLNTDERNKGQWESRFPKKALVHIRIDAAYVAMVLIATVLAIFLTWRGSAFEWLAGDCTKCNRTTFDRYALFYLGGQLGGTLFGIKYLYNVVARGWWNIDRRLWRLFSPFLSAGLALAVGALIDAGMLGLTLKTTSGSSYLSLGFITGYFADSALRKMKEIAETVFGPPEGHATHSAKSK